MTDPDSSSNDETEGTPLSSLGDLARSVRERTEETRSSDTNGERRGQAEQPAGVDWDFATSIEDASNVLVLGSLQGDGCNEACTTLLSPPSPADTVVAVTVTRSARNWLSTWRQFSSYSPARMAIVSLGEEARESITVSTRSGPETIAIETLSDPSDLTRLGITLSRLLSEAASADSPTTVCVHSLTALLQYVEPQRLFRFLHILRGRLSSVDAVAHYHLDPTAHDERTVGAFRSLFDVVVRVSGNGELEVVSRTAPE